MAIKPYQILNLNLATAETAGYPVYGEWGLIRVLNARNADGALVSDVIVQVQPEDLAVFDLGLGQAALMSGVRRWTFKWAAQAGVTVQIGCSTDPTQIDWDMDPPTQLVVTGSDPLQVELPLVGLDDDTVAARTFAFRATIGKEAAKYCYLGLWNPADSGVKAFVTSLALGRPDAAGGMRVGRISTALLGGSLTSLEKVAAGAVPKVLQMYERAVAPITMTMQQAFNSQVITTPVWPDLVNRPLVLMPGEGIAAFSNDVNLDCDVSVEWVERAV